jgi:hypothetical protein
MGLGTTLCHTCPAIFEYCIGPGRGWVKEGQREEERNEIKEEEFTVYDQVY